MKSHMVENPVPVFRIEEGYEVRDYIDDTVGTVKNVRYSDDNPRTVVAESVEPTLASDQQANFVTSVAEAIAGVDEIPEAIRSQLLQKGYVRIDRGFLKRDAFVTLDQVASVIDGVVHLNVMKDELLSF